MRRQFISTLFSAQQSNCYSKPPIGDSFFNVIVALFSTPLIPVSPHRRLAYGLEAPDPAPRPHTWPSICRPFFFSFRSNSCRPLHRGNRLPRRPGEFGTVIGDILFLPSRGCLGRRSHRLPRIPLLAVTSPSLLCGFVPRLMGQTEMWRRLSFFPLFFFLERQAFIFPPLPSSLPRRPDSPAPGLG